ncbi:hypothetical protein F7725_004705 [Dissostichus mawsoni]|uniref:Ig-like domain-containing protein n=1 Tax=Dissostichus mawsoni TaxID=36200 RepID=A0A7J5XJX2_DISMA|nr:hypothetical protein F7725_004705 [Dissostichus mawsoni]
MYRKHLQLKNNMQSSSGRYNSLLSHFELYSSYMLNSIHFIVFISQSTNQGPATDHMINQDEIKNMPEYSTLLHGDRCLYETIGGPVEAGNGASNEPEESLYINVAAVSIFLITQSRRISHKQKSRLSVLDVKMGHTLLSLLGVFLLNLLYRGQAQDTPKPVLTVSPSFPSPGASVTLNCRVDHPSAGWSFYWYKAVPQMSGNSYSYELLPGSENGTEQDLFIIDGQTHTAGYYCRAGRGDPVFYSWHSEPTFIWSGDLNSAASLTVSPDSVQHFPKTSVSLSCEGNSTEWRVRRFSKSDKLYHCSSWGTMTGSTCTITSSWVSGVFWCESETGQFSNAVNITKGDYDIILVSPVRPVAEGLPVTLSCKFKTENVYNVDFYKNDKLIQNDTRSELTISAVSKSDEGFYKCKQRDSADASGPGTFPILLIVGLLCGVSLIILLLLFLYLYRKSKDNACLYETIRGPEEPANGMRHILCSSSNTFLRRGSQVLLQRIKLCILKSNLEKLSVKMQRNIISNNVFCKDKTNGNNIPKLNLCLLNLICSFALHSSDSILRPACPHCVSIMAESWSLSNSELQGDHPSAGWSFYWYKAVPQNSDNSYSYELLPGSENGTEQDLFIIDGQTHTAGYVCRAAREDPVYYSSYSKPAFVWSGDLNSAASLTVSPDSVQHFTKTSVSLSCEGNSTEWRTMTGSTYTITSSWFSGVFWCESETGQFTSEIILVSPVRPVAEGSSVTLSCKLNNEAVLYNVDFYKNGKLIQNDTRRELTISAVSKSDEGFYKCKQRDLADGRTSSESWFSVKASRPGKASTFPVLLTVGLLCGVLLIILPAVPVSLQKIKRSQSTNQGPATDHMINQDEIQNMPEYSTLLHGASNEPEESLYSNVAAVPDFSSYAAVSIFLFTQSRRISQKQRNRLSVLDMKMGHTLLSLLGFSPVLTVSPSWPSPGASVTLNCRVDHPSAGWSFYWYKAVPRLSDNSYSYELLPGSENGTEQDLFIIDGQTHTAGYVCRAGREIQCITVDINSAASLTVSPDSVQHFTKTPVSLSCEGNSTEWRVRSFLNLTTFFPTGSTCRITRSWLSGVFWCESETGQFSNAVNITKDVTNRAVVTLRPNWPQIYSGEMITLTCEIKNGGVYEWEYFWMTPGSETHQTSDPKYTLTSQSGDYRCMGRLKGEMSSTQWSDVLTLKVSYNKPLPVLTVSPSWPSPGASVTLNCSVDHPSAGWSFYWYKAVPQKSGNSYSYELLPGSENGTEEDLFIIDGQTHTAGYVCRAGREDRVFYNLNSAASLTVSPDSVQHFTKTSVSLSCEGNSSEWRVMRFSKPDNLYPVLSGGQ